MVKKYCLLLKGLNNCLLNGFVFILLQAEMLQGKHFWYDNTKEYIFLLAQHKPGVYFFEVEDIQGFRQYTIKFD